MNRLSKEEREDKAINQFCHRVGAVEGHPITVLSRPDRERPGTPGCDAIIERGGRRFALEHTTVDSFAGQRADDARFRTVVVPLRAAVAEAYPDLDCEIGVPTHSIPTQTDWGQLASALQSECIKAIAELHDGDDWQVFQFPGIPFTVWISREQSARGKGDCYVMRSAPPDKKRQLEDSMAAAILSKRQQLDTYKQSGLPTILLIESDDIALVNRFTLAEAFSAAAIRKSAGGLDEVFIVEAYRNPPWFFPVKIGERSYPDLPEFRNFFHAQYQLKYGSFLEHSR